MEQAENCPGTGLAALRSSNSKRQPMQIRVGYELIYQCPQPTPMVVTLSIHPTRVSDIVKPDHLLLSPSVPVTAVSGLVRQLVHPHRRAAGHAPAEQRRCRLRRGQRRPVSALGRVSGRVESLPEETLLFLLGSRYCETDLLVGSGLAVVRRDNAGLASASRRSATSSINTSSSATASRAQRRPRFKPFRTARACVATSPIWPSRSAGA